MKALVQNHLIIFSCMILFCGCIEPYELSLNTKNKRLVVEGLLTDDLQNPDTLKIQYSAYYEGFLRTEPLDKQVEAFIINITSEEKTQLTQYQTGKFLPPTGFKVKPFEKYLLRFSLSDGQQYESTIEQLTPTPPILKIYEKFNPNSRLSEDGKTFLSANEVFIDFKDTPNQKNFYLWRYIHFEKIAYCITCNGALYNTSKKICVDLPAELLASVYTDPYYDYRCLGDCYDLIREKQVNVFSDVLSDGGSIDGRLISKIPYFHTYGCLIEVQQMCISPEVFSFYKILEQQSQQSGGLADAPPAAIVGNIRNITNPNEKVVGCFGFANIQKKRFWIDRKGASGDLELILGHPIIIEVREPHLVQCKKSATRTPLKPEGWQF